MVDLEKIIHRFKEFRQVKTQKEIAKELGISDKDFSNRKKRGTLLPLIIDASIHESVDLHWLLKGEGKTIRNVKPLPKTKEPIPEPDPSGIEDSIPISGKFKELYPELQTRIKMLSDAAELNQKDRDLVIKELIAYLRQYETAGDKG